MAGELEQNKGAEVPKEQQLAKDVLNNVNSLLDPEALELVMKWMEDTSAIADIKEDDLDLLKVKSVLEKLNIEENHTKLETYVSGVTDPIKRKALDNLLKAVNEGLRAFGLEGKEQSSGLPGIPIVAPDSAEGLTETAKAPETPKPEEKDKDTGTSATPPAKDENKDKKEEEKKETVEDAKKEAEENGLGAMLKKFFEMLKDIFKNLSPFMASLGGGKKESKEDESKGDKFTNSLGFIIKELNLSTDIKNIPGLQKTLVEGDYEEVNWDNKSENIKEGDVLILGPADKPDTALVTKTTPLTLKNVGNPEKEGDKLPASEATYNPETHKITAVLRKKSPKKETDESAK